MTKNRRQKLEARRRKEAGAGSYTRALREVSEGSAFVRKPIGVPTGFSMLDEWTGGWTPSGLSLIAARPGDGKSAFAIQSTLGALQAGKSVLFSSLEMSADELLARMIASKTSLTIPEVKQEARETNPYTGRLIRDARWALSQLALTLDDDPRQTVAHIRARALELIGSERGLDLIVVDYFELIMPSLEATGASRQEKFAAVSRDLKLLALELGVAVLVTVQLNRFIGEEYPPKLSDIRWTGALEQDADQVLLLHRRSTERSDEDILSLNLAKHRRGPSGQRDEIGVSFSRMRFVEHPTWGNPILRIWANSIRAGQLQLSELFELYPTYWQTVTYDHLVTPELVAEAAQEAYRLERIFRRIWWSSTGAPEPTEPKLAAVLKGWTDGVTLPERETLDEVVVWDLGEDGENWLIEGTTDGDLGLKALALWIEEVEPEVTERFESFPEDLRNSFTARDDWFWRDLNPAHPNEDMELCWKSRDEHRWNGEQLFRGIHAGG